MNHNALIQAATAVGRAEKALAKLEDAASIADATDAWIDFLSSFSRLYTKLEAGSKADDESVAWFAGIKRLRKDDQLLYHGLLIPTRRPLASDSLQMLIRVNYPTDIAQ